MNGSKRLAVAVFAVTSLSSSAVELHPVRIEDVKLGGVAGEYADQCIRMRAYSDWAKGDMYEECVNAFRTHWDDMWGAWQGEYWGKTMLCFAGAVAYTGDEKLKTWVLDRTHAFVKEFQWPNGYLSTQAKEDFLTCGTNHPSRADQGGWSIWGRKYTMWALVELYKATGDEPCLTAAERMADHLCSQMKRLNLALNDTGAWYGISPASILSPLMELYRLKGKPEYLALARQTVEWFDGRQCNPGEIVRDAFRKEKVCVWHKTPCYWAKAYEIMSCLEGLVDYFRVTGDRHVLDAVLAYYGHLEREELNAMGSVGYFDHFVNATEKANGMSELCDVVYWIRLNRTLLLLTGEAKYADRIEEAFYNAFLAGVTRDGRWGAHIIRSHGTRHLFAPQQVNMREHQCCPDNMMRGYFDFAASTVAFSADGALDILLYSDVTAKLPGATVRILGGYPWAETPISVNVDLKASGKVRFRVPAWSKTFRLNGKTMTATDGWASVDAPAGKSAWELRFDLSPRIVDSAAREDEPLGSWPVKLNRDDVATYTTYFMTWMTPEMNVCLRSSPASRILRGPLVLAKGKLAGTTKEETLLAPSIRNLDWKASLRPMLSVERPAGVPAGWMLTLTRGVEAKTVPVADFASLSNTFDPSCWFSVWF